MTQNLESLFLSAQQLHKKDLNKAEIIYRQILKENDTHVGALHFLAILYSQQSKYEQAIPLFLQAILVEPDNQMILANLSEVYNTLGHLMYTTGKINEAFNNFSESLKIKPDNLNALIGLANIKIAQNKIGQALDIYNKITIIQPHHYFFNTMGYLFSLSGNGLQISSRKF